MTLITARNHYGYNTPEGRMLSMLSEQMLARAEYVRPEWAGHKMQSLDWMIAREMRPNN